MTNTKEVNVLQLKVDIQKVIDACNDDIDSFLARYETSNEDERELLEVIHKQKKRKLHKICGEMIAQYERKD